MIQKFNFSIDYTSFSEGRTCRICRPVRDKFRALQKITGSQLSKKVHLYLAHASLTEDVEKSKYTGITKPWSNLGTLVQSAVDNGGDPLEHWVHQRRRNGTHIFGFRYWARAPDGKVCGMFYADGSIWYQCEIEIWYSAEGDLDTVTPTGPGVSGDKTREWQRSSRVLTSEEQAAATRGILCLLK